MAQILVTPITIFSKGDESVGIFSATWTITEDVWLEQEDLETFREELRAAWEFVADDAEIIFKTDKHHFNEREGIDVDLESAN